MDHSPEIIERPDGKLVLHDDGDPAIQRVIGARHVTVGLDLAMAKDRTAYCVVELVRRPRWVHPHLQELEDAEMTVMAGDFVEAANYHELVPLIMNLFKRSQLARARLIMDISGPGRAVADAYANHPYYPQVRNLVRVNITGGEAEKRAGAQWNVSRNVLLEGCGNAIQNGELRFADFQMKDTLKAELESFTMTLSETGRKRIAGGSTKRGVSHADLALACALGVWGLSRPELTTTYGPRPLGGLY